MSRTGETVADLRKREAEQAIRKLREQVIPALESVIMGVPSGPTRDRLTDANIILHAMLEANSK